MAVQQCDRSKCLAAATLVFVLFGAIYFLGSLTFAEKCLASVEAVKEEGSSSDEIERDILQKSRAITSDFEYQREGRTDPFMPFISEEQAQAELKDEETKLTGMQLFEPGQLTLVAIINTGSGALAMVQDSVGKGYVLHKGMKIGRTGVVTDIVPNRVFVKEEAFQNARTKEIHYKTTEMVLKKEGVNE